MPAHDPASPADSLSSPALTTVSTDTTQSDSLPPAVPAKIDTVVFKMPGTAFKIASARAAEFLFQDLSQLFSNTLPAIPIAAGEVGQPHYLASGELPARLITILVDSVYWIPGVYSTVNLTGLPEAGVDEAKFEGMGSTSFNASAAVTSLRLAGDSLNYVEPLTRVVYSSGPFGADATRVAFSRAFSRHLTGALNVAFSNADGQFIDLPYEGHKGQARFDYHLEQDWRLSYLHFNTRNETGIAVPFFPEEWPEINGAFHKEERLYHAVEWAPSRKFFTRAFYWQMKAELNDPARKIQHRLRDAGGEVAWQRQRERLGTSVQVRTGSEQIQSNSILPGSRWYGTAAATLAWKPLSRFWLQGEGQYQHKANWPAGHALSFSGLWQFHTNTQFWVRARRQLVPPALAEKDNSLNYLSANPRLQAVELLHLESGFSWRRNTFALQAQLGSGRWQEGFIFTADSAAGPAYLRNDEQPEQSTAARLQFRWQPRRNISIQLLGAHNLQKLPPHYWFWYHPEGFARLHLEARRTLFKNNLEVLPRLSVRYLGERTSPVLSEQSVLPQFKTFEAVTTLDFHLRLRYGTGAMLFSWENLLNKEYQLRDGVPDPGLVFRWGFQWLFRD